MTISQVSLTNTFLDWLNRTNETIVVLNGLEVGTIQIANTAINGRLFNFVSNNSSFVVVGGSPKVSNTVYLNVNTTTDGDDTSTLNIATANVVNTVKQTTRAAFGQANNARGESNTNLTTTSAAFDKANAANVLAFTTNQTVAAAFGTANSAGSEASLGRGQANLARDQANTAYNQANNAYATANLNNVITTRGDLIVGGTSGVNQRLPAGSANTFLTANGSTVGFELLSAHIDFVFGGAQGMLLFRDANRWNALAPGISGQFLKSQGSGANVVWTNVTVTASNTQIYTANATWTKPEGLRRAKITLIAGGGGGGGVAANNADRAAGGGGGGGHAVKIIQASDLGATESVVVGQGGNPGNINLNNTNVNGNSGISSAFGTHLSATGGSGGVGVATNTNDERSGGPGGVGSDGDINGSGGHGFGGTGDENDSTQGLMFLTSDIRGGPGGQSLLSQPIHNTAQSSNGANGILGTGGTGASDSGNITKRGGWGGTGIVIVEEFFGT